MTVLEFQKARASGRRLSMSTCYDAWSARLLAGCGVDAVLVGDSVAMVVHGYESTVHATVEMMVSHTAAVRRGWQEAFIIGDLPFGSFRKGLHNGMEASEALMRAGANGVKLEGIRGHADLVRHLVESGIPVMGHLGLTPQSIHRLGGYRVQGRKEAEARQILEDAHALEAAGAFSVVLECVPAPLAQRVTESLSIPTIGIGSGVHCNGQVLVLQDLLGMNAGFQPKFLRTFADGSGVFQAGVRGFVEAVKNAEFPNDGESFFE